MKGMDVLAKIEPDDGCISAFITEVWSSAEYRDSHEDEGPQRLEAYIRQAAAACLRSMSVRDRTE
ncbi:hypothetical protein [Streptomyces malaysiensis]|uniref:hypothetical protein n=1 Tax=Streptomyces malaysiensis TaxID=92644 RepID=UPI00371877C3